MTTVTGITGRAGTAPQGPAPGADEQRPSPTAVRPAEGAVDTPRPAATTPPAPASGESELDRIAAVANRHRADLLRKPHVLGVRVGYKFVNGHITDTPAIVVLVDRKVAALALKDVVPESIAGVLTDIAPADPYERLRLARGADEAAPIIPTPPRLLIDELQPEAAEAALEAVPHITYTPPADGDLSPVTGAMTVTCHVSPDAGWRVLEPFLTTASRQVCLGMYDFTAPHIYRAVRGLLKNDAVRWRQTLGPKESLPTDDDVDSTKADDLTEDQVTRGLRRVGGDRFENAFAHVGAGRTFASAYHIKVAVRDRTSFWLSSGNWQSSNQPDIDFLDTNADLSLVPRFNREWHVVVDNARLAKEFQVYLEHDFTTARAPAAEAAPAAVAAPDLLIPVDEFLREETTPRRIQVFAPQTFAFTKDNPLTVQPILTPDNYADIVLALLRNRPSKRLYFQNQSLNPVKQPEPQFAEMMQLLARYSQDDDLDVRLIFRNIGPIRRKLESLQAAGFNMSRVKMQSGCHTKGIIIDSHVVLVGSHNFTNQGVLVNRDASLLIDNEKIAQYYEQVFLHDWEVLARDTIREEAVPIPASGPGLEAADVTAGRYVQVPWSFITED